MTEVLPEGHEAPPPGVRTMGIVRWVLIIAVGLLAVGSVAYHFGVVVARGGSSQAGDVMYHCPMHPQIRQDHPGECPICGMSLVPTTSPTAKAAANASDAGRTGGAYYCPMHPHVTSDDPNARCELCGGMKLVPRPTDATKGVPGLVPVELTPERVQLIGMKTTRVTKAAVGSELRTVGLIAASERGQAQINVRFSGYVEKLLASETGQTVRRGQVLAQVYSPEVLRVQQELLTARGWQEGGGGTDHHALTRGLDADARRRLELLGVSGSDIDRVLQTGRPMASIPVRSPVDGHVVAKNVIEGSAVQPGVPLFEVADLSTVWVLADVYETEISRLRVGQTARVTLAAYPGEQWKGKVQFVAPTLTEATRTLRLRVEVRNTRGPTGPKLKPGMYGEVALDLPSSEALLVPREALVDTGEAQYVFVAREGGRFEPRRVTLGRRTGETVQVSQGLSEGETVVTTANFLIDAESRLRATLEGGPR